VDSGVVLEQVCEYLYYHERYKGMTSVPDMDIPPELTLELALAADFLECTCLVLGMDLLTFSG
jgi:transcription elongation factor B subunit 1